MSKLAVANFPELYEPILIVNAPAFVAAAWALFTPLIPAETRRKIAIVSSSATLHALEQHIDRDDIPRFLGGRKEGAWPRAERVPRREGREPD